jgi:DNA-directed RNA polymerase subunit H (RpoH/RPB5)
MKGKQNMEEETLDITKHTLVPKHEKLSEEDSEKILKKYNITITQFPKIFLSDPAIQHLEPEVNQIIEITRKSPTSGEVKYYRVVVNG